MNRFVLYFASILLTVSVSVYVIAHCEKPEVWWGVDFISTHDEALCDASVVEYTAHLGDNVKSFVVGGNVDHYSDIHAHLPDIGYYSIEVKAIYSEMQFVPILREATNSDGDYYIGGCSESIIAEIIYDDPDIEQGLSAEGKIDIWDSRRISEYDYFIREFTHDHDSIKQPDPQKVI